MLKRKLFMNMIHFLFLELKISNLCQTMLHKNPFYMEDNFLYGWLEVREQKSQLLSLVPGLDPDDQDSQEQDQKYLLARSSWVEFSSTDKQGHGGNEAENMIYFGKVFDKHREYFYNGHCLYVNETENFFSHRYPLPRKCSDTFKKLLHSDNFCPLFLQHLNSFLKNHSKKKYYFVGKFIKMTDFPTLKEFLCYLTSLIVMSKEFEYFTPKMSRRSSRHNLFIAGFNNSLVYGIEALNNAFIFWRKMFPDGFFCYNIDVVYTKLIYLQPDDSIDTPDFRMYFLLMYRNLHVSLYILLQNYKNS